MRAIGIICSPQAISLSLLLSLCFRAVSPADIGHRNKSDNLRCHANVCCVSGSSTPIVRTTVGSLTGSCTGPVTVRIVPLIGFCTTRRCRRSCLSGGINNCYRVGPGLFRLTQGTGTHPICTGPSSIALGGGLSSVRCTMARGGTARPTFHGRC